MKMCVKWKEFAGKFRRLSSFIPRHDPVNDRDVQWLKDFISDSKNLVALTGAGISTESGIPDYRSEGVGLYARTKHKPIEYQQFMRDPCTRQRYWARNFVGWERFSKLQPNVTHTMLQQLEEDGPLSCIITQNVDNLHHKAGSQNIITLHGTAYIVVCTNCHIKLDRHKVQEDLLRQNEGVANVTHMLRPDGDVDIPGEFVDRFRPPKCARCHADLKPDIVFFGDAVPKAVVAEVQAAIQNCDSLLVLGSSLQALSSYRIVSQAVEQRKNVSIINIGQTRADRLVRAKISARCSEILTRAMT